MYGEKAKNLHVLQALDLHVPEFYEINAKSLRRLDDVTVVEQLTDAFIKWCNEHDCETVAVRSSAEDEDSVEQSFAGQYTSVMNIQGKDRFLEALKKVAKSKPSTAYSNKKGLKVHAIVQRYIEPDTAGVLFTVNPASGRPEMLINAVVGHGSKVVEGDEALSIHVDRVTNDIRATEKDLVLSVAQTRQLQRLGEKVEDYLQSPQDIEWAFAGNVLYALQTRPITRIGHLQVWDNANIGESFPGIVTPLTFSISRRGYELVYKSQGYEAGLSWYQLEASQRTFNAMVGLFAGRMYYNLANWYRFIGLFPNNSQNQKYLDEQLQTVGNAAYLPPSHYPLSYKLKFSLRVVRRTLLFEREKKRYWRYLENSYKKYESLPIGSDLFILLDRYAFIEQTVIPHMGRSADNDFFVMIYHGILKNKFRRWFGEDNNATDFLGALHDVISARQANLLSEIANYISNNPTARKLLQQDNYEKLDEYLLSTDAGKLIKEYRAKFLHRFAEDQKIEAKNPLLPLSGFYGLVKTYRQLDSGATKERQKVALEAEKQRNDRIMQKLGPIKKFTYKVLLWRLKHHLRIREHNRLLRGKAYAYLRALFIQVGKSLQSKGQIDDVNDVYYLDIEELFRLVNGTGYNEDIKQVISLRKKSYEHYKKIKAPARFITTSFTDKLPKDFTKSSTNTAQALKSLAGTISSPGTVEGKVIVLDKPIIPKEPFDILVVSHTDPGWTPLIALAKGLIIEHGGILSHAAIVTRELGIPSIIGVEGATQQLKTGMKVRINSAKAAVEVI